jgi:phospholipid/cholesterol/gamma-HCH transport system substrate-binding protein
MKSHSANRNRAPRARLIAIAVVAIGAVTAASSGMAADQNPSTAIVVAKFADASPLLVGNDVKLLGVKVGSITSMSVDADGQADVGMELDAAALPLHTDAKALVRPVSLLGERYLELDRGSDNAPVLPRGAVIPSSQTGQNTDLDQVLNTVDDPTGQSLAALVTVLGEGAQGNGANIADTIKALAPAMTDTQGLADVLNQQNALVNGLVDKLGPVATALADDKGKTLDGLVSSTQQILNTTAANQQALDSTLAALPATVQTARDTLAQLTGTVASTVPTLQAIKPVTGSLTQISAELQQFAGAAQPALAGANPVLEKAQSLLDEARPVVETLSKSGPDTKALASSLKPIAGELTDNIDGVFAFIKNWALATNGADGLSHYFRAGLVVTPDTVSGAVPGLGSNLGIGGSPAPLTKNPGGQPVDPQAPQQPGGGPAGGLLAGGGPAGILGSLLSPTPSPDGGVTGLTQQQESGVLGFLLGGN